MTDKPRLTRAQLGRAKQIARVKGFRLVDYLTRRAAGEKWCWGCQTWHAPDAFVRDRSREDGLAGTCRDYRNQVRRTRYLARRPDARPYGARGQRQRPFTEGDTSHHG